MSDYHSKIVELFKKDFGQILLEGDDTTFELIKKNVIVTVSTDMNEITVHCNGWHGHFKDYEDVYENGTPIDNPEKDYQIAKETVGKLLNKDIVTIDCFFKNIWKISTISEKGKTKEKIEKILKENNIDEVFVNNQLLDK